MRLEAFREELPTLWSGDPQHEDRPRDGRFAAVVRETQGMVTENELAMLNLAASCLDADAVYVEIGALRGTTIIGAALGNDGRQFFTIDNFSEFRGQADECRRNLDRFGCNHMQLIEGNAWEVVRQRPFPRPVGVYFYDGRHMFWDQWAALERVEPLLADEALVIINDTPSVALPLRTAWTRRRGESTRSREVREPVER